MEDLTQKFSELLDKAAEIAKTSNETRERVLFASAPAAISQLTETQSVLYLKATFDARGIKDYHSSEADKIKSNPKYSENYRNDLLESNQIELERKLALIENNIASKAYTEIDQLKTPMLNPVPTELSVQQTLIDTEIRRELMKEPSQAKRESLVNEWLRDSDEQALMAVLRAPRSIEIVHPDFRNDLLDRFNRQLHPENFERIAQWEKTASLTNRLVQTFLN